MAEINHDALGRVVDSVLHEEEFRYWGENEESHDFLKDGILRDADAVRRRAVRPGSMGQTRAPALDDVRRDLEVARDVGRERQRSAGRRARLARTVLWALLVVTIVAATIVIIVDRTPLGAPIWLTILVAISAVAVVGISVFFGLRRLDVVLARWRAELRLSTGVDALEDLHRSLQRAADDELKEVIREHLREAVAPRKRYQTTVGRLHAPGLAELRVHRFLVGTTGTVTLRRLIERMPGGSIGISGPRGAGKTTLLERACDMRLTTEDGDQEDSLLQGPTGLDALGVKASAPVKFESRDFLLHLTSLVCWAVLETAPGAREEFRARMSRPDALSLFARPLQLGAVGLVLLGGVVAALPFVNASSLDPSVVLGAALVAAGYMLFLFSWRVSSRRRLEQRRLNAELMRGTESEREGDEALRRDAGQLLERIKFQQTYSTGWSGGLRFPVGIHGKMDMARSVATLQMSLPEVAEELEGLLRRVTARRNVVVGIDELDKMVSRDQAYEFLNEIKVVFGLRGCFFLISVSEEALGSFERRGMPFRDVFDSAFDEIVSVPYLVLDESSRLLAKRVIGLPEQFIALCHCLGGGLPRDVIRSARELATFTLSATSDAKPSIPLGVAARHLIAEELEARVRGALIALRDVKLEPELSAVLTWVRDTSKKGADTRSLLRRCDNFAGSVGAWLRPRGETSEGEASAQRGVLLSVAVEVLTYGYYAATVLQYFNGKLSARQFRKFGDDPGNHPAQLLAAARQSFSVSPRIAWERVSLAREKAGLAVRVFPEVSGADVAFAAKANGGAIRGGDLRPRSPSYPGALVAGGDAP